MWLKYGSSALLITVIFFTGGKATYLTAKAQLAQFLLEQAWQTAATTHQQQTFTSANQASAIVKPWPWADIELVAKLHIPGLQLQQIVLNNHSGEAMAFGPGLIENNGGFVLAGHRDSHFRFLAELDTGDQLIMEMKNASVHRYRVAEMLVIDTRLQPEIIPPSDSLVLITCYPFNQISTGGPLRYIVIASPDNITASLSDADPIASTGTSITM